MPLRSDQSDLSKPTPLDYVKYAFGVLAALLLVPALLQGALAFLQTFLQTLLSIVLTLNLLILSAVAGVAGVWIWQRRVLADSGEPVTIDSTISVEPSRETSPALVRGGGEPQTTEEPTAAQAEDPIAASSIGEVTLDRLDGLGSDESAPSGFASLVIPSDIASGETISVTIPDVVSETPRSPSGQNLILPNSQPRPEPLIQAQLARRLGVSSSTIGVRKLKPDFGEWSSQKDPAGLAWRYCEEARQFFVMSA